MREIGYAIVGCGAISVQHLAAISSTPGARVAAVQSRSEQSARATGQTWNAVWYTDLEAMLNRPDVDAAVICTPSGMHGEHALAAIRHGKHVIIEKPLALALADADQVLVESHQRGLVVSTISQRRFEPIVVAAHNAIKQGALGQVVLIEGAVRFYRGQDYYDSADWRGTIALDGGALMNQAIHVVDLVRWMGGPVASVAGHVATLCRNIEAEDTATASIRFASGTLGNLVATTCAHPGFTQELRIFGDKGHIHIANQQPVAWQVPGIDPPVVDPATPSSSGASDPKAIGSAGHARQYADITEAIRTGHPPAVTGEDGRDALKLVLAVYESSRTGNRVRLEGNA